MARSRAVSRSRPSARKAVLSLAQTKCIGYWWKPLNLYHNMTGYVGGILNSLIGEADTVGFGDGVTYGQQAPPVECRSGSKIHLRGVSFRFSLLTETHGPNACFKVIIFKYKSNYVSSLGDASFWCGQAGYGTVDNAMSRFLDQPNTSSALDIKVLKTFIVQHQPNYASSGSNITEDQRSEFATAQDAVSDLMELVGSGGVEGGLAYGAYHALSELAPLFLLSDDPVHGAFTGKICTTFRDVYIPFNSTIEYPGAHNALDETSKSLPVDWNIGVAAVAYDANDTLTTDAVGRIAMTSKAYFKEM